LIHSATISTDASSSFRNRPKEKHLDIFNDCELYVNILLHPLVPPQRILSEKRAREVLNDYAISLDGPYPAMPLILTSDPVAKFLGARHGQMIIVKRPCYTQLLPGGEKATTISYRAVVTPAVTQ
jgi:DNA-directed RNA polymerase subunit H (RpoH/RPB5)